MPQESLRKHAVNLASKGVPPQSIAKKLGVSRSSVYAWVKRYANSGDRGLRSRPIPGRPVLHNHNAWQKLLSLVVAKSPRNYGYKEDYWNQQNLENVLRKKLTLFPGQAWLQRMLARLGLKEARIKNRLRQHKNPAVQGWLEKRYPQLLTHAKENNALIFLLEMTEDKPSGVICYLFTSTRGNIRFFLSKDKPDERQLLRFLKFQTANISKKIILLIDDNGPLKPLLNTPDVIASFHENPDFLEIHPLSNTQDTSTTSKQSPRLAYPPISDLDKWVLLLNQSLQDFENPLSSFLQALGEHFGGFALISSNLLIPSTMMRRPPADVKMDMNTLIALNKKSRDIWPSNPFVSAFHKPGDVYTLDEVIRPEDQAGNAYCQQLRDSFVNHIMALCFSGPENTLCGLFITRQFETKTPFEPEARQFLQSIRPHLENAMSLAIYHWRSTFTINSLKEATDNLEIAALILDGNGRLIDCSSTANNLLNNRQYLDLYHGQLTFPGTNSHHQFEQAVARAIQWRQAPIGNKPVEALRLNYSNGDSLGVLVQAMTPPSLVVPYSVVVAPHVIVFIRDPSTQITVPTRQLIMQLFNLSLREAQLSILLTEGKTLQLAAQSMNITAATARTYLQHVYEKVGVNRRQDLVQRVMKSVALLA